MNKSPFLSTAVAQVMLVVFVLLFAEVGTAAGQAKPSRKTKPSWEDNFDGKTLDAQAWSIVPRGSSDWDRHMSPLEGLCEVKNGKLILKGLVNSMLPNDTAKFLTGGVWGKDKQFFGKGRLEIRAKLGTAAGFWPAIWLLAKGKKWPSGGEIDIMEHLNSDTIVYQTIHTNYSYVLKKPGPPNHKTIAYKPGKYNVFAVELHSDSLVFFVNGLRNFSYPRLNNREAAEQEQFPFDDQAFYLILSAQLGGSWVGKINKDDLPVEMKIDWVRFYGFPANASGQTGK